MGARCSSVSPVKPLSGYAWRAPSGSMGGTNSISCAAATVYSECQGMGGREPKSLVVIAFYVGDRSRDSAKELWAKIALAYREQATFHTDQYDVYTGAILAARHKAITKQARKTNHIERFNNTLRQRVSRLVRDTLSFSKKPAHHIGAIKYFIGHDKLTRVAA
jgi:insertion element IS1 protein InsB